MVIKYSINNATYVTSAMSKVEDTNYTFTFENLKAGDDVKYYIEAKDDSDNKNVDPSCGELGPHHFEIKSSSFERTANFYFDSI